MGETQALIILGVMFFKVLCNVGDNPVIERFILKKTMRSTFLIHELGRSQDLCQGQKKVEECCGSPMLFKEPRGLSQVKSLLNTILTTKT